MGSRPALRLLLLAQAAALVFFAAVIPIEVAFAKSTLDAGNFGYGALLASWGAGTILGAIVFARTRRQSLRSLIGWSTLAVAAAYLLTGVSPTLALACAASVLGGAGNGVQYVAVVTAVQELTAGTYQARIASLLDAVTRAAPGLGFLLGGLAAAAMSPRATYALAGAGVLGVVAVAGPRLARVSWVPSTEERRQGASVNAPGEQAKGGAGQAAERSAPTSPVR